MCETTVSIWSPTFASQRPPCASWSPSSPSYSPSWRQHVRKFHHRASRHSACNEVSLQCINSTSNFNLLKAQSPIARSNGNSLRGSGGQYSPPNAHLARLGCHLAHLIHYLGANMSENAPKNPIFEPTLPKISPKMPQSSLPTIPKLSKTYKNLRFFNVFRYPAHVPKSPKNAPKTTPRPPKLS